MVLRDLIARVNAALGASGAGDDEDATGGPGDGGGRRAGEEEGEEGEDGGGRSGGAAPTPQGFSCLGARSRGAACAATTAG